MDAPFPQEEALEAIFTLNQRIRPLTPTQEVLGEIREEQEQDLWAP
jgi:hypothetical protein